MKFLLCLLPVITHAQITINIQASKETSDDCLKATGISQSTITAEDEKVFHLTGDIIKKAVANLTGRTPTDVFLHDPTPWNNLYKTYGWQPVKTIIKPSVIRVTDVETNEVVLRVRNISNEDSSDKKEEVSLTAKVENKVTCLWKQNDSFTAGIGYDINLIRLGLDFKLNSTFGQNVMKNKITAMKSPSVEFVLKPKQQANIVFKGTKVKVLVEVEYWVKLIGHVATNNEVRLNGHHFWRYDVSEIMKTVSLRNLRKVSEMITIEYYTDGGIVVE